MMEEITTNTSGPAHLTEAEALRVKLAARDGKIESLEARVRELEEERDRLAATRAAADAMAKVLGDSPYESEKKLAAAYLDAKGAADADA